MNRKAVLLPGLAMAGAVLAATLMGCGAPAAPAPAGQAAGQLTTGASSRPASAASSPQRPVGHTGNGVRPGGRPSSPATPTAGRSPVPHSPGHSPVPSPRGTRSPANGLYTDAPDGAPHYTLALSLGKDDVITGSVNFLYQDGRAGSVGQYTGELSSSGKLTIRFRDGKDLTGTYAKGAFTFASCGSVLAWAKVVGCVFTYHGHTP